MLRRVLPLTAPSAAGGGEDDASASSKTIGYLIIGDGDSKVLLDGAIYEGPVLPKKEISSVQVMQPYSILSLRLSVNQESKPIEFKLSRMPPQQLALDLCSMMVVGGEVYQQLQVLRRQLARAEPDSVVASPSSPSRSVATPSKTSKGQSMVNPRVKRTKRTSTTFKE